MCTANSLEIYVVAYYTASRVAMTAVSSGYLCVWEGSFTVINGMPMLSTVNTPYSVRICLFIRICVQVQDGFHECEWKISIIIAVGFERNKAFY